MFAVKEKMGQVLIGKVVPGRARSVSTLNSHTLNCSNTVMVPIGNLALLKREAPTTRWSRTLERMTKFYNGPQHKLTNKRYGRRTFVSERVWRLKEQRALETATTATIGPSVPILGGLPGRWAPHLRSLIQASARCFAFLIVYPQYYYCGDTHLLNTTMIHNCQPH